MDEGLQPNILLSGRYLIEKEIGRGAIGIAYLAHDQQLISRPVVVKVLFEESYRDEWIQRKFRQEMESLARIDHPGVVGILDTGNTEGGKPYLVMQYVEGVSLRTVLADGGVEPARAASLIRQIGLALGAAHEKGVFHRDLKPENILIQRLSGGTEQVKLIDFGLAKVINSRTAESSALRTVVGSIGYMSPEQLASKPISAASDVYALGVIAYEMVTGGRPFNPDSAFEMYDMQRQGVRIKPREVCPELSWQAESAILKALAFEVEKRYSHPEEFSEEFAGAMEVAHQTSSIPVKQGNYGPQGLLVACAHLLLAGILIKFSFFRFDSNLTWIPLLILPLAIVFLFRKKLMQVSWSVCAASLLFIPVLGYGIWMTPPVIRISLQKGDADNRRYTLNYSDPKGYRYTVVETASCVISIDPTRFNQLSDYSLQIQLSPHVEFADVFFDQKFQISSQLLLEPSNTNDILMIRKTRDDFRAPRTIRFTYKYRTKYPGNRVTVLLKTAGPEIICDQEIPL